MVFDNADDPKVRLTDYFPTGGRGDIIITSRNSSCQQYSTVGFEEPGRMAEADAKVDVPKGTVDEAGQVVNTPGCLALAIAQAGAYVRETACTLEYYLQLYTRRYEEVLDFHPNARRD